MAGREAVTLMTLISFSLTLARGKITIYLRQTTPSKDGENTSCQLLKTTFEHYYYYYLFFSNHTFFSIIENGARLNAHQIQGLTSLNCGRVTNSASTRYPGQGNCSQPPCVCVSYINTGGLIVTLLTLFFLTFILSLYPVTVV